MGVRWGAGEEDPGVVQKENRVSGTSVGYLGGSEGRGSTDRFWGMGQSRCQSPPSLAEKSLERLVPDQRRRHP